VIPRFALLLVPIALLVLSTGCDRFKRKVPLEDELRGLSVGGAFKHTELLDLDNAATHKWKVLAVSSAASNLPVRQGNCRAFAYLLQRDADPRPIFAVTPVICDDGGFVPTAEKKSRVAVAPARTWTLADDAANLTVTVDVGFIDALDPKHQVLWTRLRDVRDGYLTANEFAYAREDDGLHEILNATGADPASYATTTDPAAVLSTYAAAFLEAPYPRRFQTTHTFKNKPLPATYIYIGGKYRLQN
jgi:hypothetical protein